MSEFSTLVNEANADPYNGQIIALHFKFFHPFVPSIFPAYMKISLPKKSSMRILSLANIE